MGSGLDHPKTGVFEELPREVMLLDDRNDVSRSRFPALEVPAGRRERGFLL